MIARLTEASGNVSFCEPPWLIEFKQSVFLTINYCVFDIIFLWIFAYHLSLAY